MCAETYKTRVPVAETIYTELKSGCLVSETGYIRMPLDLWAGRLGVTPQSVAYALKKLIKEGMISSRSFAFDRRAKEYSLCK